MQVLSLRTRLGLEANLGEHDPFALFQTWFEKAEAAEPKDANACAVATADATGSPSVRMVLLKGFDATGFFFYTNLGSRKARDLASNPRAEMLFYWKSLERQIRISGDVVRVSDEVADAYFASRARSSQLGAWASRQSERMDGRFSLERNVAVVTTRFPLGKVPRPEFWSGFQLQPERIEFWQSMPFRLHKRFEFIRVEGGWERHWLYP